MRKSARKGDLDSSGSQIRLKRTSNKIIIFLYTSAEFYKIILLSILIYFWAVTIHYIVYALLSEFFLFCFMTFLFKYISIYTIYVIKLSAFQHDNYSILRQFV